MVNVLITTELKKQAQELKEEFEPFYDCVIKNHDQLEGLAETLGEIKTQIADLNKERFAMTRPLDASKKAIIEWFTGPISVLTKAECAIKQAVLKWDTAQRQIAAEQQRELERIERLKAEKERKELAAAAIKEAESGNVEKAEVLLEESKEVVVAQVKVAPAKLNVKGVAMKDNWKVEVTDKLQFIHWALKNDMSMIQVDQKRLNSFAKLWKGEQKVPGVRVFNERGVAARKG